MLEQAVAPYIERSVTPVLTLDRLAGLTYLVEQFHGLHLDGPLEHGPDGGHP